MLSFDSLIIFFSFNFYLFGVLTLVPVWIYVWVQRPGSYREIIIMGVLMGFSAIVIGKYYALTDYWTPTYVLGKAMPLEDFLYGFLYGGIVVEVYEVLFRKFDTRQYKKQSIIFTAVFIFFVSVATFLIVVDVLHVNSIVAHILPPVIIGVYTILFRRDLLVPSLYSGITVMFLTVAWQKVLLLLYPGMFVDYWMLDNLSNIFIFGVLLEEWLFAFALGFGVAHIYEFVTGRSV